jgi:putative ABC transport system permease protein
MRLVRLLALRHLRRHPLRAALAVVGVAAGTALAVSVLIVQSSVGRSVEDFGRQLGGASELRVVGNLRRGGLDRDVVQRVASTEGVAAAVPVVQGVAIAAREGADDEDERPIVILGVDCRAEALVGYFGCVDELVADDGLDTPLVVGPGVDRRALLRTPVGPVPLDTALPGDETLLADLADGEVALFGLDTAQRVFDRQGRFDVAYVVPERGTDVRALRQRLDEVVGDRGGVLGREDGPPEVESALAEVLPLYTLLALFALGTGAMLVFNTASLSVEERRRDLAVVSALGGTPRLVATTTLAEAFATGAVGGLLGAAGGLVVAGPIVASLSSYTRRVAGIPLEVHAGTFPLAMGVVLGIVVSLLAAWAPVRRAVRSPAAAELSGRGRRAEGAVPASLRRAVVWGAVSAAGLVAVHLGNRDGGLEPWQVPAGALGFAVTAVGLLLCGASLATFALRPLARLTAGRAEAQLAMANLVREPRRTGVMVAAVGAAVSTAFVVAGYSNGVQASIADDVLTNMRGVTVSAAGEGANINLDSGLSQEVLDGLAELPEVAEVNRGANVLAGAKAGDLVRVAGWEDTWLPDPDRVARGAVDAERFRAGEAMINTTLARDTGLRPGDEVGLPTPGGTVDVPIMAVTAGGGATGHTVIIPYDLHRRIYGPQLSRSVGVVPKDGVSTAELVDAIEAAGLDDSLIVSTPAEEVEDASRGVDAQLAPFRTLQQGLLAVSFVAVLSTLLLVGVQRQREFGLLGALGTEPGMLGRMVVAEAGAVALLAIALGVAGGLVMLYAIVLVAPLLIGFTTPYAPAWSPYLTAAAVALVVTVAAAVWPAARAARTDIVVALRDE